MKIAFLNPSVGGSTDRRKSIPIGLAYIMAYLRSKGIESSGFDFGDSQLAPAELVERYRLWEYDLIGMSVYNESFYTAIEIASVVKKLNPECYILMGGPQATATHNTIISDFDAIDGVIRMEGEHPTFALVEQITGGRDFSLVPNLTWRDTNSQVHVNTEMPAVEDLDSLPFPDAGFASDSGYVPLYFYDHRVDEMRDALAINTSRSCPYNCNFCGVLTIGRRYRSRTPESIIAELQYFREHHKRDYTHIYFSDANFFVRAERCLEIVQALHDIDDRITFSFGTRVNQVLRAQEIIQQMIPLGLRFIELGIESASPAVLKRLAKGVEPEVNEATVAFLTRIGVEIALDFIMVDPASEVSDLKLNIDFLKKYFLDFYPHDHFYTSLALYEGTPARDFYEERQGKSFLFGALPETRDLFENPELIVWWDMIQLFREEFQLGIDQTLAKAETLLKDPRVIQAVQTRTGPCSEIARLQLDTVALRHAPLKFFERLVDKLSAGIMPQSTSDVGMAGFGVDGLDLASIIDGTLVLIEKVCDSLAIDKEQIEAALYVAGAAYQ